MELKFAAHFDISINIILLILSQCYQDDTIFFTFRVQRHYFRKNINSNFEVEIYLLQFVHQQKIYELVRHILWNVVCELIIEKNSFKKQVKQGRTSYLYPAIFPMKNLSFRGKVSKRDILELKLLPKYNSFRTHTSAKH